MPVKEEAVIWMDPSLLPAWTLKPWSFKIRFWASTRRQNMRNIFSALNNFKPVILEDQTLPRVFVRSEGMNLEKKWRKWLEMAKMIRFKLTWSKVHYKYKAVQHHPYSRFFCDLWFLLEHFSHTYKHVYLTFLNPFTILFKTSLRMKNIQTQLCLYTTNSINEKNKHIT